MTGYRLTKNHHAELAWAITEHQGQMIKPAKKDADVLLREGYITAVPQLGEQQAQHRVKQRDALIAEAQAVITRDWYAALRLLLCARSIHLELHQRTYWVTDKARNLVVTPTNNEEQA